MLDRGFPTPSQYNSIKHFDDQVHDVRRESLEEIGRILVKYQMHYAFCAFLLHRHNELLANSVMVHIKSDSETETCRIKRLKVDRCLSPCSFYLDTHGDFKAFEYKEGPDVTVAGEDFLKELGLYLDTHQLRDTIGISTWLPSDEQWVEKIDEQGTTARRITHSQPSPGIATEWAFFVQDGEIAYKAIRRCDPPPEGGGHVRS
ncbi:hypothetical protein MMC13_005420 [Lambiella insularis]|nr:hypothetical protein [Lambiella insularis]